MILISHRGNVFSPNLTKENSPPYIQECLDFGYHCEIDINVINDELYLGHDGPEYKIDLEWLTTRKTKLWIHCKNLSALSYFNFTDFNYFWHEKDKATLTSKGFIWAFPGMQPIKNSIAVLPEIYNENLSKAIGVCSDYLDKYAGLV